MITREQKRMALETARLDYDDGDQWGWAMGHFFAVADTLHHMDANIPYRWHYGHGAACRGAPGAHMRQRSTAWSRAWG